MIEIGTSGFLFDDWVGTVYPRSLRKSQWLPYYERVLGFRILELNSTFYSLLQAKSVTRMIQRTTPGFRFVVKAHHALTHGPEEPGLLERFRGTLRLFREAGRFAGTLAQFPPRFLPTRRNFASVERLHEKLGDPLVVEFRNRGWSGKYIWEKLRRSRLSFCVADLPALRPLPRFLPIATAESAYLRLHGRNPEWYARPEERYDYRYSEAELRELVGTVRELQERSRDVMVFFNNCRSGHAAQDALRLARMIG